MAITAAEAFRDYETDGVPSSGSHKIKKSDMRNWGAWVEGIINAFTANGGLVFSSKATLDASLAYAANTMAWVIGDATVANNGVYGKVGASGTGSWTRRSDLPFSFIIASDAGAGTANAIQATTSIPVSGSALVWMNIFEANTSTPVTVSFNGGSALTIKTNAGNDVVLGGLTAGMIVMGIVSGSTFRLVSDQASAAVVAAAEAAQAAAEAAAASINIRNVEDRTALKALNTTAATLAFLRENGREGLFKWTTGDHSSQITADTAEAFYVKADAVATTAGSWVRQYSGAPLLSWFGAVGDGTTSDDPAVAAAVATGRTIDGSGLTYSVSTVPSDMLQFTNAAFIVAGIVYPAADFIGLELSKISSTPFYSDWVQDKACTHKNKIIVPFQMAHGHTFDTTRIVWTISFDNGETFSAPEIILDQHADPANYGYNVFAAGVKDNRFVMVVEERVISTSAINALFMYDRVLDWSSRKTNGIALTAGSAIATITETAHGLMPGDRVNFSGVSGTDVGGLTGELTVVSVLDADRFTVNKGSNSVTNQANTGGVGWLLGSSWYENSWRITSMPLFPDGLGNPVTHVHSFANKPNSAELFFGFHNGNGTREVGVIHVTSFYGTPAFTKRRFPSTYETSAAEPCIRYVSGKIYATTRGQSSASNGSSFLYSVDDGQNWTGARFPGTLHYTPLPFEIHNGDAYIFGTERSEGEWEAGAADNRDVQSRPRSFMLRAPVAGLEAGDFSNLVTTVIGYGIYEGEQTSSGAGVGSTIKTDSDIWYFFGSEDWRVSTRYSYNLPTVDDEFIGQGYQPDIFASRLRLKDRAGMNSFVLRAPDTRVLGQYRYGNNTKILAPLEFDRAFKSPIEAPQVTGGRVIGRMNYRTFGPLIIASDAVTLPINYSCYYVDTEGGAATDNLVTINDSAAVNGDTIMLFSASSSRDVTLVDATGNLRLAGNFTLATAADNITLRYFGGNWYEVARSTN